MEDKKKLVTCYPINILQQTEAITDHNVATEHVSSSITSTSFLERGEERENVETISGLCDHFLHWLLNCQQAAQKRKAHLTKWGA